MDWAPRLPAREFLIEIEINISSLAASLYGGVHDYDLVPLVATDKNVFYSNIQILKDTDRYPIRTEAADWDGYCQGHLNYQDNNYAKFGVLTVVC